MNLQNKKTQTYQDAVMIGKILQTELLSSYLEAFSENAVCSSRGISAMKKYKTVKEVCALTGLTRKHLYYFHHEKVVEATAFANYSVYDYDGYKLYDDAAVEKLQQIALYYQLGLKRNEIRDIMRAPDYDPNKVLSMLLKEKQFKRLQIDRHIAVLEFLKMVGLKNGQVGKFSGISLEVLGEALLTFRKNDPVPAEDFDEGAQFEKELSVLLHELSHIKDNELYSTQGTSIISQIFALGQRKLGIYGSSFIIGLFASAIGEGELAHILQHEITAAQYKAVIQYIARH